MPYRKYDTLKKDTHGTRNCYRAGCRCEPCMTAEGLFKRDQYRKRVQLGRVDPNSHGTHSTYRKGCRCTDCTAAWRTYMAGLRAGRRPKDAPPPKRRTYKRRSVAGAVESTEVKDGAYKEWLRQRGLVK